VRNPEIWTVARRIAAIVCIGAITAITVAVIAAGGMKDVRNTAADLTTVQSANLIVARLDTRASELKVDGYKTLVRSGPQQELAELSDDVGTVTDLLTQLAHLRHTSGMTFQRAPLDAAYRTYIGDMTAFVHAAVANQKGMRARYDRIQQSNDKTDAAVGKADAQLTHDLTSYQKELAAKISKASRETFVATLVGLLVLIALSWAIARSLVRPLHASIKVLTGFAAGDLTRRVQERSAAELGELARAINGSVESVSRIVSAVVSSADAVAASSGELSASSQQITASAEETSAQAGVVSGAAEEVSRNVATVAAGAGQMGASIREIAHSANEAARVASEAVVMVDSTNESIAKLGTSSQEIGNVVKVITSIAEQTNLLALNATIEAARAGEAGRGFAVVANEVKELAQETARATEDIARRVEAIQADAGGAVGAIGEISSIITAINDYQLTIASAVEEQTATTGEMSRNLGEASSSSSEIASNITSVATSASTTTQAVTQTLGVVEELARMSAGLREEISRFTV
jgi:methyl-accepting chemotaxis protein